MTSHLCFLPAHAACLPSGEEPAGADAGTADVHAAAGVHQRGEQPHLAARLPPHRLPLPEGGAQTRQATQTSQQTGPGCSCGQVSPAMMADVFQEPKGACAKLLFAKRINKNNSVNFFFQCRNSNNATGEKIANSTEDPENWKDHIQKSVIMESWMQKRKTDKTGKKKKRARLWPW